MAEQHSPIIEFPCGRYSGRRMRDPPKGEAEYFYRCPVCGGWVDCRDLGQVFDHEGAATSSNRRLAPTKFNCALVQVPAYMFLAASPNSTALIVRGFTRLVESRMICHA